MNQELSVAILGLDAADHNLIERWAGEGLLPTLAKLLDQGAYGILETSAGVFSGSAWLSITNGCGPGECGVYSRYQLTDGTYDVRRIRAEDCKVTPFWAFFRGPVVVVDIPKVPVISDVNGVQVVEWGAYDHYSAFASLPAPLADEISRQFGSHPFVERNFEVALHSRRDFDLIKKQVIDGVGIKQLLNESWVSKYKPRLFFSVFGEPHAAGHAFWRFQDSRHPRYVPQGELASAMLETYQALDRAIGSFLEQLQDDTRLVILSSQGFALDSMMGEGFLAEILVRMGLSTPKNEHVNYSYVPYAPALALDMSRTRAFCLPTDLQGYIRINLRGREPQGIVSEADYESVCREVETELLALRDRTHGNRIVERVVRVRECYPGRHAGTLPDLSVIWNSDHVITDVESPRVGVVPGRPDLLAGGGNHRGPGFIIVYGRDVLKGRFNGHVYDVAPTISRLLGERNRPEWTGRPLPIPGLNWANEVPGRSSIGTVASDER
jgi:predicted AlkP superfamily phosphohydrolase/phosphomutase